MSRAFLNQVTTAVPAFEIHSHFGNFAKMMVSDRERPLVDRMIQRSGIDTRYAVIEPRDEESPQDQLDRAGMFTRGSFPTTATRMEIYDREACTLARKAADQLDGMDDAISHLVVTSCTGFSAPGVDLQLLERLGLPLTTQRTMVGFMGCYAAINGLRVADAIVRADQNARVLVVSVELCSLHLQETADIETLLSFMIFADGASAALVSAEPHGVELTGFRTALMPAARDLITWHIGDQGFDMRLSGEVPKVLGDALPGAVDDLTGNGRQSIDLWAIHPGGRSILDACGRALQRPESDLDASRTVLRQYGNMSSPSIMFVMAELMRRNPPPGASGLGMAFGPGLTAEGFTFVAV